MEPGTMFEGFGPVRQAGYERAIADRYGEDLLQGARRRVAGLPPGAPGSTDADLRLTAAP